MFILGSSADVTHERRHCANSCQKPVGRQSRVERRLEWQVCLLT